MNLFLCRVCWAASIIVLSVSAVEEKPKAALIWDAISRKIEVQRGQTNLVVFFHFANVSSNEVVISALRPTCSCTSARLGTELPWHMPAGADAQLDVLVDLRDRLEPFKQVIAVETSAGTNQLILDIKTPELTPREKDRRAAFADREAVFKGQCATCHLQPALGKPLAERYRVLCGTCHDSDRRAEMVPALGMARTSNDRGYWEQWLRRGKPGTFMPAFSKPFGGPLTEDEIVALAGYLVQRFKPQPGYSH